VLTQKKILNDTKVIMSKFVEMKYFIVSIVITLSLSAFAQQPTDSVLLNRVNKVKLCLQNNDFKGAEDELRKVFSAQSATLPDEVAYYHGVILFNKKKYSQAKTSLTKYLTLTKEKGVYANDARALIKETECAETGYYTYTDTCQICHGGGRIIDKCPNCGGKGVEFCRACGGSGVAANSNNGFGNGYTTCKRCEGKGYHTCSVCNGKKKQTKLCDGCKGTGITKVRLKCIQ